MADWRIEMCAKWYVLSLSHSGAGRCRGNERGGAKQLEKERTHVLISCRSTFFILPISDYRQEKHFTLCCPFSLIRISSLLLQHTVYSMCLLLSQLPLLVDSHSSRLWQESKWQYMRYPTSRLQWRIQAKRKHIYYTVIYQIRTEQSANIFTPCIVTSTPVITTGLPSRLRKQRVAIVTISSASNFARKNVCEPDSSVFVIDHHTIWYDMR